MYKNKIIVFGVGTDFYSQVMRLKKEYDIICICDNNTDLHKKKILGFRVITPTTITEYQFDFIKICSLAHTTAIRNQILNLGIPESKILPTPLWCTANSQNWERLKNETKKNLLSHLATYARPIYDVLHAAVEQNPGVTRQRHPNDTMRAV